MRISERVLVEVTEGVAVFVLSPDELILPLLDTVAEVEDVFDTDDEALTVDVLYILIEVTGLRDLVDKLVDVLLCRADRVIVVELEGVLDALADIVTDAERREVVDERADIVKEEDTELHELFVGKGLIEEVSV